MKATVLFFAAFLGLATISLAQYTPKVSARQGVQESRIKDGVRDGSLTKRETVKLINDQRELAAMKKVAKADGKVTRRERRALDRKQDKNSKEIYRQKHDRQARH